MLVAALLLAWVETAAPYNRTRVVSNPEQCTAWPGASAVAFHMAGPGTYSSDEYARFETAIKGSANAWQSRMSTCGSLHVTVGGGSGSRVAEFRPASSSNENVIVFRTTACTQSCLSSDTCNNDYDCWAYSAKTIALTTTTFDPTSGRIYDADIEYNGASQTFTTVNAPPCLPVAPSTSCVATDVQNTTTHEIGHALGLDHIGISSSTMFSSSDIGDLQKRGLDPGSEQFVCDVYPTGKPSRSCVTKQLNSNLGSAVGCSVAPMTLPLLAMLTLALARKRRA